MVLTLVSVGTLLAILAFCAVIWWAVREFSLPQPVTVIAGVIVAFVAIMALLNFVGIHLG